MKKRKTIALLPPSMREKKRYICCEIISEHPVEKKDISPCVWQACHYWLGIKGTSQAGIWVIPEPYDEKRQRFIIRAARKETDNVKAALTMITHVGGQPAIVRSVGISGIIKKVEQKYLNNSVA